MLYFAKISIFASKLRRRKILFRILIGSALLAVILSISCGGNSSPQPREEDPTVTVVESTEIPEPTATTVVFTATNVPTPIPSPTTVPPTPTPTVTVVNLEPTAGFSTSGTLTFVSSETMELTSDLTGMLVDSYPPTLRLWKESSCSGTTFVSYKFATNPVGLDGTVKETLPLGLPLNGYKSISVVGPMGQDLACGDIPTG